jgi:hypothetical protein
VNPARHHSRPAARAINGSAGRADNTRSLCCPSARMWKLWREGAMTGSIAGEHARVYIWDKEAKHDRPSGSLAMRAFRRGHLLYHPAPWHEAGYLRNRALDLVELHARSIGHNYRGQPGLTSRDPSNVVGFSSFAAALLLFAQLKTDVGLTGRASPAPRTSRIWAGGDPVQTRGPRGNGPSRPARVQRPGRRVSSATPAARARPVCV